MSSFITEWMEWKWFSLQWVPLVTKIGKSLFVPTEREKKTSEHSTVIAVWSMISNCFRLTIGSSLQHQIKNSTTAPIQCGYNESFDTLQPTHLESITILLPRTFYRTTAFIFQSYHHIYRLSKPPPSFLHSFIIA